MRDTLIPTFNRNPGQCPTVSGPVETERADVYFRSMEAPNVDFTLSRLERVISGPGKITTLGEELERRGLERGIVVTGKSLGSSRLLEEVTGALGTISYFFATHEGFLAVTAVLTSLYPAITIMLARVVLGERLTVLRLAGLTLAAGCVALIAVGGAG